jgi:hypothetical protein
LSTALSLSASNVKMKCMTMVQKTALRKPQKKHRTKPSTWHGPTSPNAQKILEGVKIDNFFAKWGNSNEKLLNGGNKCQKIETRG